MGRYNWGKRRWPVLVPEIRRKKNGEQRKENDNSMAE